MAQECQCIIGEVTIDWTDIREVAWWIAPVLGGKTVKSNPAAHQGLQASIWLRHVWATRRNQDSQTWCLLNHVFPLGLSLQCTDPRDRVYGLLSMTLWPYYSVELQGSLKPDYTKSIQDVFRDVVRAMIEENQNLWCLSYVTPESVLPGSNGYCSWAFQPDFHDAGGSFLGPSRLENLDTAFLTNSYAHGSRDTVIEQQLDKQDLDMLRLGGIFVDVIKRKVDLALSPMTTEEILSGIVDNIIQSNEDKSFQYDPSNIQRLAELLSAGQASDAELSIGAQFLNRALC